MTEYGKMEEMQAREFYQRLLDKRESLSRGEGKVKVQGNRGVLEGIFGTDIPEKGLGYEGVVKAFDAIDSVSTHWGHANFYAYFPSTISDAGLAADLIHTHFPVSSTSYDLNPHATKLEEELTEEVRRILYLPERYSREHGGHGLIMTTTGNGSLLAVHVSKYKKLKELGGNVDNVRKLVGYYPTFAHSHCIKALILNGIQETRKIGLVLDKKAKNFAMDLAELKQKIEEDKKNGLIPFICFAAFGATSCCGIDDMEHISTLCKQNGMEIALDGAYSGAYVLNEKYQEIRETIKLADYYQVNLTKMGYCGIESSIFYCSDRRLHAQSMGIDPDAKQLATSDFKIGENTKTGAHRIFFTFQCLGKDGFRDLLLKSEANADTMRKRFTEDPRFELFPMSKFSLVCFRATLPAKDGESEEDHLKRLKKFNSELRSNLQRSEEIFLVGAEVNGHFFLRLAMKHLLSKELEDKFFAELEKAYQLTLKNFKENELQDKTEKPAH